MSVRCPSAKRGNRGDCQCHSPCQVLCCYRVLLTIDKRARVVFVLGVGWGAMYDELYAKADVRKANGVYVLLRVAVFSPH
jgi:hypothetical protein